MPEVAPSPLLPTVTLTVRAVLKVVSPSVAAVTVTVVPDTPSETLAGFAERVSSVLSSSPRVMPALSTVRPVEDPDTVIVSSPSMILSCVGVRVNVPVALVWPAAMVMSRPGITRPHATV